MRDGMEAREGTGKRMATGKKNTAPLTLVFGNDSYWVEAAAKEYLDQRVPESQRVFGLDTIDGMVESGGAASLALRKCLESLDTPAFMGGEKVVWLKNASFLAASGRATRGEEVKGCLERLTALIKKGLMPGVFFLITAPGLDKRSAFYKACEKAGELREFAITDKSYQVDEQAAGIIGKALADAGLTADSDVVVALAQREGCDTRQIRNEVEKLSLYAGERRRITVADVEAVVCAVRGSQPWDLADAVLGRDLGKALQVLSRLLFQKTNSVFLVTVLEGRFRELLAYREALDRGWLRPPPAYGRGGGGWDGMPEEAATLMTGILGKDPRALPGFVTGIRAKQAMVFSKPAIRRIQKRLLEAHRLMVTSPTDPQWILELLLIRILGRRPAARPRSP